MRRFSYHAKGKMPLEIVVGDILENQSEVLVMPLTPRKGRLSEFAKTVYDAAGYEDMKNARYKIGRLYKGNAAYTSGFGLSAKYVVHVSVPEWYGGFSNEPKYLSKCYCNAIKCAVSLGAKSISFPLLGAGSNRVPPNTAKTIAEDAIRGELRNLSDELNVVLVISPTINKELNEPSEEEVQKQDTAEQQSNEFLVECANKMEEITEFQNITGCHRATITRIRNGKTSSPHKNTAILIALWLNLSKQDRIKIIKSAGKKYPSDDRDRELERIIEEKYEKNTRDNIVKINADLYNLNYKRTLIKTKE